MAPMSLLMLHLLLLSVTVSWPVIALESSSARGWQVGFDYLADYEPSAAPRQVGSVLTCAIEVTEAARLFTFNATDGYCREFKCRMGLPDCRKCRNIGRGGDHPASGQQEVWTPKPYADYCWATVQHRVSDSVDFYRNWSEYKAGFGDGPSGNFWLGLDALHSLANSTANRRVLFLMKSFNDTEGWALYSSFIVGPESDNYRLNISDFFSGTQSGDWDSMAGYSGQAFSTKDRNNDVCANRAYNCAYQFNCAWWFKCCAKTYPNARYYNYPDALNTPSWNGILWSTRFGSKHSLMEFEMLVS